MNYHMYTLIWKHKETGAEVWQNFCCKHDDPREALTAILATDEVRHLFNHRLSQFSGPNSKLILVP